MHPVVAYSLLLALRCECGELTRAPPSFLASSALLRTTLYWQPVLPQFGASLNFFCLGFARYVDGRRRRLALGQGEVTQLYMHF